MLFLSSSVSRSYDNNKKGVIFNIGICTTPLTSKSWQFSRTVYVNKRMHYFMLKMRRKICNDDSSIHSVLDQETITNRNDSEIKSKLVCLRLFPDKF